MGDDFAHLKRLALVGRHNIGKRVRICLPGHCRQFVALAPMHCRAGKTETARSGSVRLLRLLPDCQWHRFLSEPAGRPILPGQTCPKARFDDLWASYQNGGIFGHNGKMRGNEARGR